MKKILTIITILITTFSLTACKNKSDQKAVTYQSKQYNTFEISLTKNRVGINSNGLGMLGKNNRIKQYFQIKNQKIPYKIRNHTLILTANNQKYSLHEKTRKTTTLTGNWVLVKSIRQIVNNPNSSIKINDKQVKYNFNNKTKTGFINEEKQIIEFKTSHIKYQKFNNRLYVTRLDSKSNKTLIYEKQKD